MKSIENRIKESSKEKSNSIRSPSDNMKIEAFFPVIDSLITNLSSRGQIYKEIQNNFEFLIHLHLLPADEITLKAENLSSIYDEDLDSSLVGECIQFANYVLPKEVQFHIDLFQYLKNNFLESSFPNIVTSLSIFLTMAVSNTTSERSFSTLSRVKNNKRSTMGHERLSSLAILTIESDLTNQISFQELINNFAEAKSRKVDI